MAAWQPAAFNLQQFLQDAAIPPDQDAILNSSQGRQPSPRGAGWPSCIQPPPASPPPLPPCLAAWRAPDPGDELQSALRAPEQQPPPTVQQEQQQQPNLLRNAAVQCAGQLFEGLGAATGAAAHSSGHALQQEQQTAVVASPAQLQLPALFEEPDSGAEQQGQGQQQTVSEACRQVAALANCLDDSPSIGAPLASALLLEGVQPQWPAGEQAFVAAAAAAAVASVPAVPAAAEKAETAELAPIAAQDAPAAAAAAAPAPAPAEQALDGQQMPAAVPADAEGVEAAAQQLQEQGEEEEWVDAAAAAALPGSQGEDDFQDAQEEMLPLPPPRAAVVAAAAAAAGRRASAAEQPAW